MASQVIEDIVVEEPPPESTEELSMKPTAVELSETLTRGIERLDVLEERLGVSIENLYVKIPPDYSYLRIMGELHSATGTTLSEWTKVVAVVYDSEGRVIATNENFFFEDKFFGFDVIDIGMRGDDIALRAHKIRVFPKTG